MRYLPLTDADRAEMLSRCGAGSIDDLFVDVPAVAQLDGPIRDLPMHASEMAVERHMKALAAKNLAAENTPFFLGAGAYRHHIPASVDTVIQRGEFLTAYTPYQPEIAQGTLQMLFEFQTQVARLYGCAVANASLYDGSTACWEAVAMATRVTRRKRAVLSGALHPHYAQVVKTMAQFTGEEIADSAPAIQTEPDLDGLTSRIDENTACVVVQYPDILGRISDLSKVAEAAHAKGALLIVVNTEPVAWARSSRRARWARISSWVRGRRWVSACNLAGRILACSPCAIPSMCARCPAGFAGRRPTRRASAVLC